jgi:hypothetical protein
MKKEGRSRLIATERLHIESKTIHLDLKENEGGRFLQIAEISNDRKSTVVIPLSGLSAFVETLGRVTGDKG